MYSHLPDKERLLSVIAFTCWHIWKARCNHIFNDKAITPAQVIHSISYTYDAFWEANHPCPSPSPPPPNSHLLVSHWCPPNESFLKINVDANWLPAEGRGCSAAVVRDHGGRVVAARKLSHLGTKGGGCWSDGFAPWLWVGCWTRLSEGHFWIWLLGDYFLPAKWCSQW